MFNYGHTLIKLLISGIVYEGEDGEEEEVVIGLWSGIAWLVGMTVFIVVLSEYVVDTIEEIDVQCFFSFKK